MDTSERDISERDISEERPRPRILIVDDEKVNRKVLISLLEERYELLAAKDGAQALQLAASKPDLILLDIIMPGMDGYDVCRALKNTPETAQIPVVFITTKSTAEEEATGLELGAVDYISKPFSPAIVRVRVATQIKLKQQMDLLEQLNITDSLTGIANRRRFDAYLSQQWLSALRSHSQLSLLLIDIDHFKQYNDNYGHQQGDECLRLTAQSMAQAALRSIDLVARYGGEEFAVILPNTGSEGASRIAEDIRQQLQTLAIEHQYSSAAECVTVSIGTATLEPDVDVSERQLIEQADQCLYQAKHLGRNRVYGLQ